jgi:hypothetical protein
MTAQDTKRLTADIMGAANAVTVEALKLVGVPQRMIEELFLRTPEFSSYRLARCQELARKIGGVKPIRTKKGLK